MQSTDGEQFWSAGQSLWSLISEHVSESELPKIHAALGHSLVDRYTEAHAEAEMWRDTHQGVSSRTGTPLPGRHRAPLADPPAVKELVRAEVRMLLQTLTERAGRNGKELLSLYKPEIVNYALGHHDRCYSNQANLIVNETRSVSRLSIQSSAEEEIEAVRENLNINGIEQVLDRLKSLFMEECEALKKEIKQLQRNIWTKSQQDLEQPQPTLGDLRELRDAIQKDLELYPISYTSSVKGIKNTHRLASVTTHQPRVLSTSPVLSYHTTYTQPRPPSGSAPNKMPTSPKPSSISSSSKCSTSAMIETRKTPGNSSIHRTSSPSRPCSSQIKDNDSNPFPIPTNTSGFPIKSQRNSPGDKTHLSSQGTIHNKGTEGNLSPQMEGKHSPGHRSRKTNFVSSPISPYECNKDSKSSDCSISTIQRLKKLNGPPHNLTPSAAPSNTRTRKRSEMPTHTSEIGATLGHVGNNKHASCEMTLLYAKTKRQLSPSPKRLLKVSASQHQNETLERTETEYLNRFIQPVPPPRLK